MLLRREGGRATKVRWGGQKSTSIWAWTVIRAHGLGIKYKGHVGAEHL